MQERKKFHPIDFVILGIVVLILGVSALFFFNSYTDVRAENPEPVYTPLQYRIRLRYCPLGISELVYEGCELMESSREIPLGTVLAVEDVYPSPYLTFNQETEKYTKQYAEHCEDVDLLVQGNGFVDKEAVFLEEQYELRVGGTVYVRILSGGMASATVTWIERREADVVETDG